jgi:ABC-type sugar transport system permease subunit
MIPFIFGILAIIFISFILNAKQGQSSVLSRLPLIITLLLVVPLTLSLWSSFEKWGEGRPGAVVVALPSGTSLLQFPEYFSQNPKLAIDNLLEAFATQGGLVPAIQAKGLIAPNGTDTYRFYENRVHAEDVFSSGRSCGVVDTNYVGVWDRFSRGVIEQSCAPFSLPKILQNLGYLLGVFLSLVSILFMPIGLFLLLLIFREGRVKENTWIILIILPSLLLRASYVFLGFQPDRYALPSLPFAMILAWIIFKALQNQFLPRKS